MSFVNINQQYDEAVEYLKPHITYRVCKKIAALDKSMDPDRPFDFVNYLKRSFLRYERIFRRLPEARGTWLEVGALFPVFPMTLARMGFKVTVVEEFGFYPKEISGMYGKVSKKYGIRFLNKNFISREKVMLGKTFDHVSLLGVIEHLPHTPKRLLENIHRHLKPKGRFFLDVPNLYYAGNVRKFFNGIHIQQPIATVYDSGIPFVGHHREYTLRDLKYVLEKSGFKVEHVERFNYSSDFNPLNFRAWLEPYVLLQQFPAFREILLAESRPT